MIESGKENAALQREIEMAIKIQKSLLPVKLPAINNVEIAYKYVPMTGVGGDFLNILYQENANKLGLFICDVSGHGVPAGLTASIVSITLDFFWNKYIDHPAKIMNKMWYQLKGKMGGNFFTACICCLDLSSGKLTIASAGHPPLLIAKNNGTIELKSSKGMLINEIFESDSKEIIIQLDPGDSIILYTDGISEAENPDKEQLGSDDDAFIQWIKNMAGKSGSPSELCQNIYHGIIEYSQKDTLDDDFTILTVKYKG